MNVIVMIPSLNPGDMLLQVVESIRAQGFSRILIINDGSNEEHLRVFKRLEESGCAVIHHAVNLGKGRALKTGFNHVMKYMADACGVVTCDADGQHEPADIKAVAQAMLDNPGKVVLGARKFFEANVPLPNLMGNTITRLAFLLLTGLSYGDTQCGLRAFPLSVLPDMMKVEGERFEYENVMLLAFRKNRQDYIEVPMRAAYETVEHGKISHFNRLLDPIRIYRKIFGFAAAPAFSGLLASAAYMIAEPYLRQDWIVPTAALCAAAGMLLLWLLSPARAVRALAETLCITALTAGLMWLLLLVPGIMPLGAWWLTALLCAPIAYNLWLIAKYGKRPIRNKVDADKNI
jgi:glycosyltransferase involved in cell wall biosynthesis